MPKNSHLIIILIVSSLCIEPISAQQYNSFVGIRFGGALPMGQFASHEFGKGGYALLGKSFGGEAAWFVSPKLGFGVDISMNSFDFASGYYAEDYLQNTPEYKSVDLLSGPYKLSTYMAGAYYKITISPKLRTSFKLMGGLFKARTPDQLYGVNTFLVGRLNFWKTSSQSVKFTFLTGASFEYKLYEQISILLQADFTFVQAAFTYNAGTSSVYTDHLNMP
ncbi:MAG: hypothetical protein Q7U54_18920, partial [Bacteroidales bacterium]|nr:hypothetical protein [Bacteroidales bacterium]